MANIVRLKNKSYRIQIYFLNNEEYQLRNLEKYYNVYITF